MHLVAVKKRKKKERRTLKDEAGRAETEEGAARISTLDKGRATREAVA